MVLVTRYFPGRPRFIDKIIKGVRVYICNIIKNTKQNEMTFYRKLGLYPTRAKIDNHTKITYLFK